MKITKIKIKNYRQYQQMEFAFDKLYDPEHDLHIIVAQNGVGKSNFLNAITWCLYFEESHLQDKYKALPVVNLDTINSTNEKGEIEVSVEIDIDINNEVQTIKRSAKYIKNDKNPSKVQYISNNLYFTKNSFNPQFGFKTPVTSEGENARKLIEKVFPQGINEYFFFDNEQMNNYFKANAGGTIKRAINQITKIELVQKVKSKLSNQLSEYKTDLSGNNEKIKKLEQKTVKLKFNLDTEKKELEAVKQQIFEAENSLEQISEEIKGAENLKLFELKRENLISQKKNIKTEINNCNEKVDSFIVKYSTLLNMYPSLKKAKKVINEKRTKKMFPPNISVDLLKKSIEECECQVCKNKLDNDHIGIVQELLNSFDLGSPVVQLLLKNENKINELIQEAEKYPAEKNKLLSDLNKHEKLLEENEQEIVELDLKMKAIPNKDEVREKLEKRDLLDSTIKNLYSAKGSISNRVKVCESELKKGENEFSDAIKKLEIDNKKAKKYEAVKRLIEYLQSTENEVIVEVRNDITKETYKNFSNLIWKENTYSEIKIDEEYNVDLIHKRGYSAIGSTSAAERALLALSFTNAIHRVSGFESPLVIDSPVGRVSDENRRRFASTLADISKEKQVIMLFTPDEYSTEISMIFDQIATKAKATMDSSEERTTIEVTRNGVY